MVAAVWVWVAGAQAGRVVPHAGDPAGEHVVRLRVTEKEVEAVFGTDALAACPGPQRCSLTLAPGLVLMRRAARDWELVVVRDHLALSPRARQWRDLSDPSIDVGAPFPWATSPASGSSWSDVAAPDGGGSLAVWLAPKASVGGHAKPSPEGGVVFDATDDDFTPIARAGVRTADRIVTVDGRPVGEWAEVVEAAGAGNALAVEYVRGSVVMQATVQPRRRMRCWRRPGDEADGRVDAPPAGGVEIACPPFAVGFLTELGPSAPAASEP